MANGTNIAASKNRGCGTFNLYMDEFCGGKITISVQWDHRKAKGEENTSSPVNSSQNVKIPSSRRSTHSTKLRKDQSSISSGIPRASNAIGSTLTEEGRKVLCELLRHNLDVFAWNPEDMTGVLRHLAQHRLNIQEGCLPIRQKKRSQAPERNKAIQEEVAKFVDAGIMKEVHYHSWLSNPVNGKKT
ncbi:hypothetical protein Tco_1091104 [Tanacetum coccineum]|uniref:Reverse transcriptase domain-containing protein n=1 Tax=Tanacetum coccineum TaxID=301880 RepID=A0ABQ5I6A5_9ASTR